MVNLKRTVKTVLQRTGWYAPLPAPQQVAEGDFIWAFDRLSEAGRTRLFDTFATLYGPRKDALVVEMLTRWLRLPAAAGLSVMIPFDEHKPMDMGRVAPLTTHGYVRIWTLMRKRAQRDFQDNVERAVQESVREMCQLLGFV